MKDQRSRSVLEWLFIVGIVSFFFWPFYQLWSIKALPLFDFGSQQKAAVALENLMAETLAAPFVEQVPNSPFSPIPGYEDIDLEGKIEVAPHPDIPGMTLIRTNVRWGMVFFRKYLMLEAAVTQNRS